MARKLEQATPPAISRPPFGWLQHEYARLRLYQWLWILFCVLAAVAVVAPRILSRPVVYTATAPVTFDTTRYHGLYDAEGAPAYDLQIILKDAQNALQQQANANRQLRYGAPDYRSEYQLVAPGTINVQAWGATASEARRLADAASAELIRQLRATGGREVLRNLLGWQLVAALNGEPTEERFEQLLRDIIERSAFPLSRPIEPVSAPIRVAELPPPEQNDLTRALEARYDLWTFEINTRNATLDSWCGTAELSKQGATAAREDALQLCAAAHNAMGDIKVGNEIGFRDQAIAQRATIEAALRYMLDTHGTTFDPDAAGGVTRTAPALPAEPAPNNTLLYLSLVVLAGVAFGGLTVALDRSVRVVPRVQELWLYRELIGNIVLRDLRTRYKSSALGYVWTQLAPLLLMLIFLIVFTVLIPSNIAQFPVFLIVALLPWNYTAEAVSGGSRSIIDNAHLIKKVFFPREVLPLASVFSALVNFVLSLPMMLVVMAITQLLATGTINFSLTFLYMPIIVVIQTIFLMGLVMFLSTLAVFWRDTTHLIGILLQFWFFLTPIFYSLDTLGGEDVARVVRWLNPMASIVDFYRDILYGNTVYGTMIPTPGLPATDSVLRVLVTSLLTLAIGYWFFQRNSGQFGEQL